jgi:Xaa-Pro aminopeptidase
MSLSYRDDVLRNCTPDLEVPFPVEEYDARLKKVQARMAKDDIEVLFVSAPEGINYLSGYQCEWYQAQGAKQWPATSGIAVHVGKPEFILFDTEREWVLSRYCSCSRDTRIFPPTSMRDGQAFIVDELKKDGWLNDGTRVGLEFWSYRPNRVLSQRFEQKFVDAGAAVVDGSDVLREVRWVKSPLEMAAIEEAARIADVGLMAARDAIRPGAMELEVYAEMVAALAGAGGENPAITQPVLSGKKANAAHAMSSRRKIQEGDLVLVDCSGVVKRYHCNMARTYACGDPGKDVLDYARRCSASMKVLGELIRPNLPVRELYQTMKSFYEDQGVWQDRGFIGGYEMGIAFHPDWVGNFIYDVNSSENIDRVFEPGTAVNYENQYFMPRQKGLYFMIETLCFLDNEARLMSRLPYELEVVG